MNGIWLQRSRAILSAGARVLSLSAVFVSVPAAAAVAAESIVDAHYAAPVERYGHFALGRPHEYARLNATTSSGRKLTLQLAQEEVFEDLAPRLIQLAPDEPVSILAIVSRRDDGARLVIIRPDAGGLAIAAQAAVIGTRNRWLNPVGVADLDGDGRAEIAAVITPHIGGTLKVYRNKGSDLEEIAALANFSNHVYGTTELALSAPVAIAGRMRLLVPDATRLHLRIIALEAGHLVEVGRCALSAALTGPIELISQGQISVGLVSGPQVLKPEDCLKQADH